MDNLPTIQIHQAYYGEVSKSHSCIHMELDEPELKSFLTGFTDRPSAIPPGISLKPYLSGVSFANYYVFTKTFPDNNSTRSGMVFTHALIIAQKDVDRIESLRDVFSLFISEVPEDKHPISSINIELSGKSKDEGSKLYPNYLQKTVSALIAGDTPIVFCGDLDSFENTIVHLWQGAPQGFRQELRFRVSFSPSDIEGDNSLVLVYVQNELASKWNNHQLIHSDLNEPIAITSHSEALLLGQTKDNLFAKFIKELNVDISEFSKFGTCDKAYNLYLELRQLNSDSVRQLIRLLEKLSPSAYHGKTIKSNVLQKLQTLILAGEHNNLKSLRNLTLEGFENGELILGDTISNYIDSIFQNVINFELNTVLEWINLTATSDLNTNWWHRTMTTALKATLALNKAVVIQNIYSLIHEAGASLDHIFDFIPTSKGQEVLLRKHFPQTLNEHSASALEVIAKRRKWFLLHMQCLVTHLSSQDALEVQLALEQGLNLRESVGVLELCKRLSNQELLNLTLSTKHKKLIKIVGEKSVSNNSFLSKIDLSQPIWLEVWAISLKKTMRLELGISDLDQKVKDIYRLIIDGEEVPEIILQLISESSYSNLNNYEERQIIWDKFPSKFREAFLESTAEGYIDHLVTSKSVDNSIEFVLKKRIISDDFMTMLLNKHRNDISAVIKVYSHFTDLKDQFLADYIKFHSLPVSDLKSAQLGDLVFSRNYVKSAYQIFEKAKCNNSYRIALGKCQGLIHLGILDKFYWSNLFGAHIDENAAFEALTELAIKLYNKGPEENDIWKRAKGDISKFINKNTREENWRSAIHLLRYGGAGEASTKLLLEVIKDDFSNNDELNALINYFRKK